MGRFSFEQVMGHHQRSRGRATCPRLMDLGKEAPGSGCDVRAGGRVAGDTSLSVRDDVETYMCPLHLGFCILKFPSPVLGGRARGLSLLGLIPGPHIYIYIYIYIYYIYILFFFQSGRGGGYRFG